MPSFVTQAFFDTFTNVVKNEHGNGERPQMGAERVISTDQCSSIGRESNRNRLNLDTILLRPLTNQEKLHTVD